MYEDTGGYIHSQLSTVMGVPQIIPKNISKPMGFGDPLIMEVSEIVYV